MRNCRDMEKAKVTKGKRMREKTDLSVCVSPFCADVEVTVQALRLVKIHKSKAAAVHTLQQLEIH